MASAIRTVQSTLAGVPAKPTMKRLTFGSAVGAGGAVENPLSVTAPEKTSVLSLHNKIEHPVNFVLQGRVTHVSSYHSDRKKGPKMVGKISDDLGTIILKVFGARPDSLRHFILNAPVQLSGVERVKSWTMDAGNELLFNDAGTGSRPPSRISQCQDQPDFGEVPKSSVYLCLCLALNSSARRSKLRTTQLAEY